MVTMMDTNSIYLCMGQQIVTMKIDADKFVLIKRKIACIKIKSAKGKRNPREWI